MAAELLATLIKVNLWAAAAILLVLALRKPVRRWFGAGLAYGLWAAIPLAILASFLPARRGPPILAQTQAPAQITVTVRTDALAPTAQPQDYSLLMLALWALGAAMTLVVLAWRQHRFNTATGGLRPDPIAGVLRAANAGVGPAVVGALIPRIVIPADFEARFTPEERTVILAHERVHLARQDARINGLVALAQALNWFNPLVHLAAFLMRIDQELACDAVVVASRPDHRRRYAEALLKTQAAAPALPLGCYWPSRSPHPLKERITMLKVAMPGAMRRTLGAGFLGITALAIAAAGWASQPARPSMVIDKPAAVPVETAAVQQPQTTPTAVVQVAQNRPAPRVLQPEGTVEQHSAQELSVTQVASVVVVAGPGNFNLPTTGVFAQAPNVPAPAGITRPDWLRLPSPADIKTFYPERALRMEKQGSSRLRCSVRESGTLENCAVTAETPGELGFGVAALQMTPLFHLKPMTVDGAPVAGSQVDINIHFR